jgi:hypothetical protein
MHINENQSGITFTITCTLDASASALPNAGPGVSAQASPYEEDAVIVKWVVYVRDDCDRIQVTPIQMDYHIAIDPYRNIWDSPPFTDDWVL